MITIKNVSSKDAALMAEVSRQSFIESHGSSAPADDIDAYVERVYNPLVVAQELDDAANIYKLVYYDNQVAGYSKLKLNTDHPRIAADHISKMDRLYLLKEFYQLKIGKTLFEYNVQLSKENQQKGMWLYVWKGNSRAVAFYQKAGFRICGSYDFKISERHSNPNHLMYKDYEE